MGNMSQKIQNCSTTGTRARAMVRARGGWAKSVSSDSGPTSCLGRGRCSGRTVEWGEEEEEAAVVRLGSRDDPGAEEEDFEPGPIVSGLEGELAIRTDQTLEILSLS